MAKRKEKRRPQHRTPTPPRISQRLFDELEEVERLMKRKQWEQARDRLVDLDRRYSNHPEILTLLVNVYYELQNIELYQHTLERLVKADPDNVEAMYGLAGAYLNMNRPVLALQMFRTSVERWPDAPQAANAHKAILQLEEAMPQLFSELGMEPTPEAWALATRHEEMQVCLAQEDYSQVRQIAQRILRQYPHFAPAHNNLSLAYWLEGRLARAIETAEEVLTYEPYNVHALANLVHFLCLEGRREEALAYAERLRTSPDAASEKVLKQMEAFTFLGDDEAVVALFPMAEETGEVEEEVANAMLYHLAAVAEMRLGREEVARRLWQKSLKIQRDFFLAKENLDDLRQPVGEQHAPWAFPFANWIGQRALKDLLATVKIVETPGGKAKIDSAIRRYMKKYPEVVRLIPVLLERGDPMGRGMAVHLAFFIDTPEIYEALEAFVFSTHGPDTLRTRAAQFLVEKGVIPGGDVQLYTHGEWQDLLLMGFEIGDESEDKDNFSPRTARLAGEAAAALQEKDWERGEQLLRQALELQPDAIGLLNNLAVVYEMRGEHKKAEEMIQELHQRDPHYLFARVTMAQFAIQDKDYERAHELLEPLLRRKKLHFSEFSNMSAAFIELHLAEGNKEAARSWLNMWESIDPDNSRLMAYKIRVNTPSLGGLFKRK
ncbi:MAG: tetratricopeptide repeat protein [Anaerolineae bacterium]|nr:tetratricopeptide repeat protein [Anaerolineae bacterium]